MSKSHKAQTKDLTVDNLTPHTIKINTNVDDERVKFLFTKLIQHAHDFVREVSLKTNEWEAAWQYLTDVGQMCTPDRQEMILFSDILGISALVDAINNANAKAPAATESSVLGPFHNEANTFKNGDAIASSKASIGEPMLIHGIVFDIDGNLIKNALVDMWETNGNGLYDMQDPDIEGPDCRGKVHTNADGEFFLNGVRAVDYPIPSDGPVGVVMRLLNRSLYRPAHVHFKITHPLYTPLTTALYSSVSPHIANDPVFGVKKSLIKEFAWVEDEELGKKYKTTLFKRNVEGEEKMGFWLLEHKFFLVKSPVTL